MAAAEADFELLFGAPVGRLAVLPRQMNTVPNMDSMHAQAEADELASLLAAVALHDRQAFRRLYERTSAGLYAVALRILDRDSWAQDVLQDAFIKVWNSAGGYRPDLATPKTWMTTIVRNQALDLLRKHRHEVRQADPQAIVEEVDEAPLPLEQLAHSEQGRRLSACLDGLKPEQRQIIALAYFKGLTHDELASRTNQPLGTVKTWIRRGLEQLKRCLES